MIAATPSRIWLISRSSGPRTAATMQNSLRAGGGGLLGGVHQLGDVSHTERTGEVNWPDWLQKWQSSGQPPVLSETMPSTSTSGPHHVIRTSWASASSSSSWSSGVCSTSRIWSWVSALTALEDLLAGDREDVGTDGCLSSHDWSLAQRRVACGVISHPERPGSARGCFNVRFASSSAINAKDWFGESCIPNPAPSHVIVAAHVPSRTTGPFSPLAIRPRRCDPARLRRTYQTDFTSPAATGRRCTTSVGTHRPRWKASDRDYVELDSPQTWLPSGTSVTLL